jgi:hypothetical protein
MGDSTRTQIAGAAESMLCWGYIYGATGWICTAARVEQQAAQYPEYANLIRKYGLGKWLGKHCVDCAQLTRLSAKAAGITIKSGASSQWKSDVWAEKGEIDTLPDDNAGYLLYRQSSSNAAVMQHTGVSIGDGYAIEARGHAYGVIQSVIAERGWTHWGRLAESGEDTTDESEGDDDEMSNLAGYICEVSNLASGTSKLNVRKSASTSASKVTTVSEGDQVTCKSDTGTWACIKTSSGLYGYCMSKYLTAVSEAGDEDDGDGVSVILTSSEVTALKSIYAKL